MESIGNVNPANVEKSKQILTLTGQYYIRRLNAEASEKNTSLAEVVRKALDDHWSAGGKK